MNTDELFIDINKLPKPLSKEEVYALINQANNGNKEARDIIIKHNIRLVLNQVFKKFWNVEYDKKDLVSIGNMGLIKAVDTFDTSKNLEFATYASRCIDNEILMFLRKIKKDKNVESIDGVVDEDKEGNELKLGDILKDNTDVVEEYTENETYQIIHKIVNDLPQRDKEIIVMRFGFFENSRYSQEEIAEKFQISQSYVSRLVSKIVKRIGSKLEEQGLIELRKTKKKGSKNKEEKKMARELQTIYKYFDQYTKEQVDVMLSKLTDEEKALITLRYGEDLEHPQTNEKWNKENTTKFYGSLLPKMKKLLANPNNEKKPRKRKQKVVAISSIKEKKPSTTEQKNKVEVKNNNQTDNEEVMTKEDYMETIKLFKSKNFVQTIKTFSTKESVIALLKFGYVNGKCFSNSSIAEFLEISELEVIDSTKKVLLAYKEKVNREIDSALEAVTSGPVLSKK